MSYNAKAIREARIKQGLCAKCGEREAKKDRRDCEVCLEKGRVSAKKRHDSKYKSIFPRKYTKKKGKWSRMARAKHSVRMQERWAAKNQTAKNVVSTNKLSISERLNTIEHHCKAIKQQLGM